MCVWVVSVRPWGTARPPRNIHGMWCERGRVLQVVSRGPVSRCQFEIVSFGRRTRHVVGECRLQAGP